MLHEKLVGASAPIALERGSPVKVKVTQFYTPNGQQQQHDVEVPDDCADGYKALRECGCRLTAEVLLTGLVSQTVEHEEGDFLIEICANGPKVLENLEKMIKEFEASKFRVWLKEMVSDGEVQEEACGN